MKTTKMFLLQNKSILACLGCTKSKKSLKRRKRKEFKGAESGRSVQILCEICHVYEKHMVKSHPFPLANANATTT